MRWSKNKQGYTIIEVMIFLAVSGFMFITAATFINGKQATAEFRQGMHDMNDEIRGIINDVNNGYYPSGENISCSLSGGTYTITNNPTGPNVTPKGSNKNCSFVGKAISFDADKRHYTLHTLVGRQFTDATTLATPANFSEMTPIRVATGLDERKTIPWGLELKSVKTSSCTAANCKAIAFVKTPGVTTDPTQQVVTLVITGDGSIEEIFTNLNATNWLTMWNNRNDNPTTFVCITNGGLMAKNGAVAVGNASNAQAGAAQGQRTSTSVLMGDAVGSSCS